MGRGRAANPSPRHACIDQQFAHGCVVFLLPPASLASILEAQAGSFYPNGEAVGQKKSIRVPCILCVPTKLLREVFPGNGPIGAYARLAPSPCAVPSYLTVLLRRAENVLHADKLWVKHDGQGVPCHKTGTPQKTHKEQCCRCTS